LNEKDRKHTPIENTPIENTPIENTPIEKLKTIHCKKKKSNFYPFLEKRMAI
jgi:hypothetical protein